MAKKDYKNYPDAYFTVIEKFSTSGEDVVLEDTYGAVAYTRHDLHRFFKAIYAAPEDDRYAADLANTLRDIVLIVEPPHAKRTDPAKLIVRLNPMAKAILMRNPG